MFYLYVCESICPCCSEGSPKKFGITKCLNLRVLKHRLMNDTRTDVFIRTNPKLFQLVRISQDLTYEDAFTLLQAYSA
jgi:hypothetical protein